MSEYQQPRTFNLAPNHRFSNVGAAIAEIEPQISLNFRKVKFINKGTGDLYIAIMGERQTSLPETRASSLKLAAGEESPEFEFVRLDKVWALGGISAEDPDEEVDDEVERLDITGVQEQNEIEDVIGWIVKQTDDGSIWEYTGPSEWTEKEEEDLETNFLQIIGYPA